MSLFRRFCIVALALALLIPATAHAASLLQLLGFGKKNSTAAAPAATTPASRSSRTGPNAAGYSPTRVGATGLNPGGNNRNGYSATSANRTGFNGGSTQAYGYNPGSSRGYR